MFDWRSANEWRSLWRYYQAGIINTLFGYGLFSLFVWLGLNLFLAQITSHVIGMVFNYFTYSRHAFAGHTTTKARFALSYAANYLLGLMVLAALSHFILSPYLAGFLSIAVVSVVNFFVLKRLVFRPRKGS
jgi:putative flippase GtrA